jgi:7-carboxy-7-deazaguanine synthase (Cx14CxxC type)
VSYRVKELFYSLQGEGCRAGRPAVFCRFSGCNLWSGREADRAQAACRICDTDFVGTDGAGGGVYDDPAALAARALQLWPDARGARGARPYVVCTGGEPLLQLDAPLIGALHDAGFEVGLETNGTLAPPAGVDWVCVSPKAGTALAARRGNELKLLYPQEGVDPAHYLGLDFENFCLQPVDGPQIEHATRRALAYCLEHPRWRLSLQLHKILRIL